MSEVSRVQNLMNSNLQASEVYDADRRGFLKSGLIFTAALGFWTPELAYGANYSGHASKGRIVKMHNAHTGEKFQGEYWYNGKYSPDAFAEIKTLMRDFRTGEKFPIDPRLMDILFVLQSKTEGSEPFKVFSGYRSPATNAKLRRLKKGVARNSLHMQGQAIDLSLPGVKLSALRRAALKLQAGGVGYYPNSTFMHIDTGRVRSW